MGWLFGLVVAGLVGFFGGNWAFDWLWNLGLLPHVGQLSGLEAGQLRFACMAVVAAPVFFRLNHPGPLGTLVPMVGLAIQGGAVFGGLALLGVFMYPAIPHLAGFQDRNLFVLAVTGVLTGLFVLSNLNRLPQRVSASGRPESGDSLALLQTIPVFRSIWGMGALLLAAVPATALLAFFAYRGHPMTLRDLPFLFLLGLILWWGTGNPQRRLFNALTAPFRKLTHGVGMGRGGSASYAGILEEWGHLFSPKRKRSIFLGHSLCDGSKIGTADDRHVITFAATRAGKGRSCVIPNLLQWNGSALVIDPKGENAAVTAHAVAKRGVTVRVLDPFDAVADDALPEDARASFNPLARLDPDGPAFVDDVRGLARLLITEAKEAHWTEGAEDVLGGIIANLRRTKGQAATLSDVRLVVTRLAQARPAFIADLTAEGATVLEQAGAAALSVEKESAHFISALQRQTAWLDSPGMAKTLSGSSFDLSELRTAQTFVYLVLPFQRIETHARFLRLFSGLALAEMQTPPRSKHPCLFVLDEFAALGRLDMMTSAAAQLASYGVKLWLFVQSLDQLVSLYGMEGAQVIYQQTSTRQFFALSGNTAEVLKMELGARMVDGAARYLREPEEINRDLSRDTGYQLVTMQGARPFYLKRANYDAMFPPWTYGEHPDHGKSWLRWIGGQLVQGAALLTVLLGILLVIGLSVPPA